MKTLYIKKKYNNFRNIIFGNSGFSLVEMLVVTTISALMILLIYSAHSSIITAIHKLTGVADFYENLNLAIRRIDRDIACSHFNRYNKKLCFIGESNYEIPFDGKLNFVTIDHNDISLLASMQGAYTRSDVKEVGYFVENDEEIPDIYYLMRREENHYDDEPEEGGENNILLENVVDLKFEFKKGNTWSKRWDSRDTHRFPKAVKTTLIVKNYNEVDETFVFITYLNRQKK